LLKRLHLLPDAPPELIKAAYKTLAMKFHPDHGGDTRRMQELNEALQLLAA
jgi:curved DNA-binding protein CbpA